MTRAKRALLDHAARLLAKNFGATLGEIAVAAGVGRATLHRHFATRDDLTAALTVDAYEQIDAATAHVGAQATSATDALRLVIEAVVPLGDKLHFLFTHPTGQDDQEVRGREAAQLRELAELVDLAKTEGGLASTVPTAWATAAIDGLIFAAWTATARGEIAARDAPALVFDTLMSGLRPRDGGQGGSQIAVVAAPTMHA